MEWINVNDRLPEDGESVLIWDNESVEIATHNSGLFEWQGLILADSSVSHWQPLPEPPNEE